MAKNRQKFLNIVVSSSLIFNTLALSSCSTTKNYLHIGSNLHTVEHNKVYRSKQMDGSELEKIIKRYNIKTVLNLRGEKNGRWTSKEEKGLCQKLGVAHYDFKMRCEGIINEEKLILDLYEIFDKADYPLLMHCAGGKDRAGAASTLYLVQYKKTTIDEAFHQLTDFKYGNGLFKRRSELKNFFSEYKKNRHKDFRAWIEERVEKDHSIKQ